MSSVVIKGNTSGQITVSAPDVAGTNTLTLPASTGTVATTADITSAFSGSNQSLTTNGYQKLPSGLIMQWGYISNIATDSGVNITFPLAFPSALVNAQATGEGSATDGDPANPLHIRNPTTSGMRVSNAGTTQSGYWFAIGY
jgi:hypothetical protein